MALILTDDQNYKNIAAAIREKNGGTATYAPGEMAAAISAGASSGLYYHCCLAYESGDNNQDITFVNNFAQNYCDVEQYLNNNDGEMKSVVIGNGYFDSYLYIEGNSLKLKYKTVVDGEARETILNIASFSDYQFYPKAI